MGITKNKRREEIFERYKKMFDDAGCPTLETEWKPTSEKWRYICDCGREWAATVYSFKLGARCKTCRYNKSLSGRRTTIEDINKVLREGDTYINHYIKDTSTRLEYSCSKGHVRDVPFSDYKQGKRCVYCFREFQRGENHPFYNPNKSWEQRVLDRKHYKTDYWRKSVFERDDYTCQKCGQYGWDLNAHHIFSYKDFHDRRLDVDNGITLCTFCHKWYHWEYGCHYEKPEDFYNFMDW